MRKTGIRLNIADRTMETLAHVGAREALMGLERMMEKGLILTEIILEDSYENASSEMLACILKMSEPLDRFGTTLPLADFERKFHIHPPMRGSKARSAVASGAHDKRWRMMVQKSIAEVILVEVRQAIERRANEWRSRGKALRQTLGSTV